MCRCPEGHRLAPRAPPTLSAWRANPQKHNVAAPQAINSGFAARRPAETPHDKSREWGSGGVTPPPPPPPPEATFPPYPCFLNTT